MAPRQRFGQHFLNDPTLAARIIDCLDLDAGLPVFEIGPGRGALTALLLQRLRRLHAVEIDRDLSAALEDRYGDRGLVVHCTDVLSFDFCGAAPGPLQIVGNLPYNISTPLLFHLLDQLDCIARMVFMLQKEVADRIAAAPGGGDYGRLSVMIQSRCRVESLFRVGPQAFTPPPRVESRVIRLTPAAGPAIKDRELFAAVVRTAFSHRRKTLRNALKGYIAAAGLEALGIDPGQRPQELAVATYAALANHLTDRDREAGHDSGA
ncbi:MAG: 16S rRNA (adenine(1518)-N(6)/adenine(1519)-N(6))-dimethyltransferase RsmA [Gammaproteobacteria bacterium]|jgi:16S rRNA (adenine1518-N6/adenine1519-N6)-dimethyltransferase